jgi:hypothetical protein
MIPVNLNSKISDVKRDLLYRLLLVQNMRQYLKFPFDENSYVIGSKTTNENEKGQIFENDKPFCEYNVEEIVIFVIFLII